METIKKEMLELKNWAIVGVSAKEERYGYKIWKIMPKHDYVAYGVSPRYEEIDGKKIYPSLKDVPGKIDVVDVVVNPKISLGLMDEIKELGIEYVFFQPETYNDEVIARAEELGLKYLIEDCIYATLVRIEMGL